MAACEEGPVELQSPFLEMPELPELFAALGEGMGGPPPGIPAALWGSMCKKRLQDMHESNHLTVSEREEHLTKRQFHVPGRGKRTLTLQEDPTGKFGGSCGSGTVLWPAAMALVEHLDGEVEKSCLNCRVLELGAGVGAVGLFLALFKGCEVWLPEAPEQLPLLVRNVNENSPDGLDLQVAPLKWGDKEALEQLAALGRFDMIVGSDVTYRPECLSDLLSTAHQLMSPQGRFFLSLQDRPGEAEHLEAALKTSSLQIRGEALRRKAKLQGAEEVSVLIFELCHVGAEPRVVRPPQATGDVEEEFFRLTGIRPDPVVLPKRDKPAVQEPKVIPSFKERVVKDLLDRGMVDYLGDVDEETKSKVAASAGYPASMLERPAKKLEEAVAAAAAEDWFSPCKGSGGPEVVQRSEEPQEHQDLASKKGGQVLKCLDGLDWELLDLEEDTMSVTVTFTEELWSALSGVSGTAFKEAVSFELAEQELRVLHAGSVVLDLRLPVAVDAPKASASVSSRKMRVAVKAKKLATPAA